jgi:outer membrane protein assembly factor BamE (lipoprotein component of BamABCDE complex)
MRVLTLLLITLMTASCGVFQGTIIDDIKRGNIDQYLTPKHTTRANAREILGPPTKTDNVNSNEVWTYEWTTREERTAMSGRRIGEERSVVDNVAGYTHYITKTIVLTLVFDAAGVLQKHQMYNPDQP